MRSIDRKLPVFAQTVERRLANIAAMRPTHGLDVWSGDLVGRI